MDIFTISTIPRRQKRPDLTRDQRIQCLTLRTLNWSYPKIADHIKRHYGNDISTRQVRTACAQGHPTPEKRSGQPMKLSDAQVELIITYVSESQEHRLLSFQALAEGPFAHFNVSKDTIRRAFFKRGYQCYPITSKPPLSEKNRRIRLEFALTHGEWTLEQWLWVFWTDETWVRPGSHKRRYVIRRADEGLDPTCVIEKIRKSKGWMFWGSFNGGLKGPSIFWEKDWGMISANTY